MEPFLIIQWFCLRNVGFALHFPSPAPEVKTSCREISFSSVGFWVFGLFAFFSPPGECGTGLCQYLRTEHDEHGEGTRVSLGGWAGRTLGEFPLHGLLSVCGRPGVPGSQSHTSRSVSTWMGLSRIGDNNVMASGFFGVIFSLKEASAALLTAEL